MEYNISGNTEIKLVFDVAHYDKCINFIAWDNLVDERTMIKIAESYRMELKKGLKALFFSFGMPVLSHL